MPLSIKNRILEYLDKKGVSAYLFYKTTGFSNGFLTKDGAIGSDKCEIILSHYPDINIEWLITGSGPMLKEKWKRAYQVQEPGEGYTPKNIIGQIPLVGIEAFAGKGSSDFLIEQKDIKAFYVVPDFTDIQFMMRVMGNSMYPKYNSGDVVACRVIQDINFIQWNKVHVLATKSQGILIKRLRKCEKTDHYSVVSDNKDYDPFEIPKKEVVSLALVVGIIRLV